MLFYQTLSFTIHGKIKKSHTKRITLKYHFGHEMKTINYLMEHILYPNIQNYFKYIFKKIWRKD